MAESLDIMRGGRGNGGEERGEPRRGGRRLKLRRSRVGLNLTAMIDVTFLLLVYFMAATEFRTGEEVYRMDLPARGEGAEVDPFALDEEPMWIRVRSGGGGWAEVQRAGDGPGWERVERIASRLQEERLDGRRGLYPAEYPIVIVPSAGTNWQHVLEVFNAAARARFTNITFGAPE